MSAQETAIGVLIVKCVFQEKMIAVVLQFQKNFATLQLLPKVAIIVKMLGFVLKKRLIVLAMFLEKVTVKSQQNVDGVRTSNRVFLSTKIVTVLL